MQEILSYRLSDLLLFSQQSYWRQFELYNHWISPFQWLFYLYGILFLVTRLSRLPSFTRPLFLVTVPLWLICSYGYLWQFYGAINWLAEYFIGLFVIQSILILWIGIVKYPCSKSKPSRFYDQTAILLCVLTLIVQPGVEYLHGRNWDQFSVFAATPDSLSYITLCFMLILRLPLYFFLPVAIWLVFSALTYLAMDSVMALFPAFALVIFIISVFFQPWRKFSATI